MLISTYQGLIAELGQSLNLSDMVAGDDGYVGLVVDGHEIHIQYDGQDSVVILFTRLQEADPDRREGIYTLLLGANLFWQGTRGATFSIDFDTGRIFLADRRALDSLDVDAASAWIEAFADVAGYWRDRIDAVNDGGPLGDADGLDESTRGEGLNGLPPGGTLA